MTLLLPETSVAWACPCSFAHAPLYTDAVCRAEVDQPFGLCGDCKPYDRRRDEDPRPVMERGELRRRDQPPRVMEIPF